MGQTVYSEDLPYTTNGRFSADVTSLAPNTNYYFKAYMSVWSEEQGGYVDIESGIGSFTTKPEAQTTDYGYLLTCGEIPAVSLSGTMAKGDETFGSTKWYRYGVSGNSNQMVVSHTFEYSGKQLRNYSMLYDKSKKAALWVAYAMHADAFPWKVDRNDDWAYDPALVFGSDYSWQPDLSSSYSESSGSEVDYDRGHQAASNDRRTTTAQTKQTSYYSNMTPQIKGFNGGVWSTNEGKVQDVGKATSGRDTLYVVTGPIFGSGFKTDARDANNAVCPVPTQYFKCIMMVTYDSSGEAVSAKGAAYLFNHESGAARQDKTIRQIETLTGFDFFTNIPSNVQETAETNFTTFF